MCHRLHRGNVSVAPSPAPCSASCGIGTGEACLCRPAPAPHRPVRPSGVVWGREVQDPHHELPASRSISAVGLLGGAVTALPALCPIPEAKDIATPAARCSSLGAAPHIPTAPSSPVTTGSPRSQLEAAPLIASPSSAPPWHHFVPQAPLVASLPRGHRGGRAPPAPPRCGAVLGRFTRPAGSGREPCGDDLS